MPISGSPSEEATLCAWRVRSSFKCERNSEVLAERFAQPGFAGQIVLLAELDPAMAQDVIRRCAATPSHITIAAHDPEKEHSNCNPSAQWRRVDDDIAHELSVEVGFDFEVFCLARAL